MGDEGIRVYPTQIEATPGEKRPPTDNSDVWSCTIPSPPGVVHIYLHNRAKSTILQHAGETPGREVGGALVGGLYKWRDPQQQSPQVHLFIEITNSVRGHFTRGSSTSLTFTADTWSQIVSDVERHFPEKRIVGWYHTHPGHGVFLSAPDKFIQNNFFAHGGQLALVIDHVGRRAAFFIGSEREPGGFQQSAEFTWDDALCPPLLGPTWPSSGAPATVGDKESPPGVTNPQLPTVAARPPVTPRGRRRGLLSRLLPSLRKKAPPAPASQQDAVVRIDMDDVNSPEVKRVIKRQERARRQAEEQERARRQAESYPRQYPGSATEPGLLEQLSSLLIDILGIAALLSFFFLIVLFLVKVLEHREADLVDIIHFTLAWQFSPHLIGVFMLGGVAWLIREFS